MRPDGPGDPSDIPGDSGGGVTDIRGRRRGNDDGCCRRTNGVMGCGVARLFGLSSAAMSGLTSCRLRLISASSDGLERHPGLETIASRTNQSISRISVTSTLSYLGCRAGIRKAPIGFPHWDSRRAGIPQDAATATAMGGVC